VTVGLDRTFKKILSINISCGVYHQSKLPFKNTSTPVIHPLPSLWPSTVHTGLSTVQHHYSLLQLNQSVSLLYASNSILYYL